MATQRNYWLTIKRLIQNTECFPNRHSVFLQGHSSYITHLDWSPDNKYIMSNSGDYEILYCKYERLAMAEMGLSGTDEQAVQRVRAGLSDLTKHMLL